MALVLPGFEYDIFISYRHNDNRSGWVTEFVNALREELSATIKEPLSIYFDQNTHDGLLETHNVDKSLEGKLKCLIFIPIISQTYCDTKSFAWQHEFVAFNKLAKQDQFGRDIKLSNGNVASRILPIKVNDLDADDKATIENEIGGVLRAIEFIYKEPGVNRPLKLSDNKTDNQNKTDYRNQLNKMANAIKEIITALKNPATQSPQSPRTTLNEQPKTNRPKNRKPIFISIVLLLLITIGYLFYQQQTTSNEQRTATSDKSIAVLPFVNMSNDPEQEYFSDGLSEELLNLLAKLPALRVIGRTSSFSFKGKNEDLRQIGEKLGVAYLLEGSVRKSENSLRITCQLISAQDGSHVWSETYDRQLSEVFAVQDEIAEQVVGQLKIKIGISAPSSRTKNIEAYNLLLESRFLGDQRLPGSEERRISLMTKALRIDSADAELWTELAFTSLDYTEEFSDKRVLSNKLAARAAMKAVELDSGLAEGHIALGNVMQLYYWDWAKAGAEFGKAAKLNQRFRGATYPIHMILGRFDLALQDALDNIKYDPLNPASWRSAANVYQYLGETNKAIEYHKKVLELTPLSEIAHAQFASALAQDGSMDEALLELDKIANKSWPRVLALRARIYFALGDNRRAEDYLNKLIASDEKPTDNSFAISSLFVQKGQNKVAMKWLTIAHERRHPSICYIFANTASKLGPSKKWFPALYGLRNDLQFRELLKEMNLPTTYENEF